MRFYEEFVRADCMRSCLKGMSTDAAYILVQKVLKISYMLIRNVLQTARFRWLFKHEQAPVKSALASQSSSRSYGENEATRVDCGKVSAAPPAITALAPQDGAYCILRVASYIRVGQRAFK